MKKIDYRIIIGSALILGGGLMLLDNLGVLQGATGYFWAIVFLAAALALLYFFFTDVNKWWYAIPGFALAGAAVSSLIDEHLGWDGAMFLGGMGLGFLVAFFRKRDQWWTIIPGGILLTLATTSSLTEVYQLADTGGVFFIGLGITFLLVGILAKMMWAYIPAAILLVLGFFLGTPFVGWLEYGWIAALLLGGILLIIGAMRKN